MLQNFNRLNLLTLVLTFCLIVLGAYVRLSNAGLGCPDWPGCYGHIGVPDAAHEIAAAETAYPERPVEAPKAWKEMVHRYLAGIVGLLIGTLAVLAWRDHGGRLPRGIASTTVGVVLMQIVFGALTVTLKVKPIIVTTHLLLGLTTLSLVFWMWLDTRASGQVTAQGLPHAGLLKPLSRCCCSAARYFSAAGPVPTTRPWPARTFRPVMLPMPRRAISAKPSRCGVVSASITSSACLIPPRAPPFTSCTATAR